MVALTGARQTGKLPTFRSLFPDYGFATLNLPTEAEPAEKEPQSFLRRHSSPVMIDEVQYAPGLFRYLKVAVDGARQAEEKLLTSAGARYLMNAPQKTPRPVRMEEIIGLAACMQRIGASL